MDDANNPAGTGDTALSVDDAAAQLTSMWDDDPETDTDDHDAEPEAEHEADAEDEGDLDEADAEADETADSDEDDEQEDGDAEQAASVTDETEVDLGDGRKLPLAELKSGYLRQADYTRKTQEVAEARRRVAEKDSQLDGAVKNVIQRFEVLEQVLAKAVPPPPSVEMAAQDPFGYQEQQARHIDAMQKLQAVQQQLAEAKGTEKSLTEQKEQERRKAEFEALVAWKPDLADPTKRETFGRGLMAAAERYGYTKDDFNQLWDHRLIKVLDDARRYQDLKAKAPATVQKARKAPPAITPKQRQSPGSTQARGANDAMKRLQKTGSIDDAARVLMNLD